jgi:RHS repeat-associated protein
VILVALSLSSPARAQITSPPDPVNRPIPGGHDYIHMLSETVNPADGSVSLDIKLPTPAGRGISVPFSITYNSGGAYFLSSYQPGWIAAFFQTAPTYGGWGNSLPFLSYGATYINYPVNNGAAGSNSGTCYFSTGYTFQGLLSGSHNLGLSATSPPPSTYANCSNMGGNIPPFYPYTNGGDSQVWSMFTGLCSNGGYEHSCDPWGQPPVTVFDAEGTIYSFPETVVVSTSTLPVVTWPATIEDRNGNIAHISAVNGIGGGVKSVTDSAGRTLVSLTYSGTSNVNPTVIAAGGLTYDLAYASQPADFSFTPEPQPPLGMTSIPSGLTCGWQGSINASENLLQTISLTNGTTYSFSYDSTYGLLNGITYPDGGWVKYTWELSPVYEQNALFSGVEQSGYDLQDGCNFLYKTPVVATRQVGFVKGNPAAITQTFSYGASWNTGESTSNQWITKTTTVTTTDNVVGRTSQTIYNYTPFTIPPAPGFIGTGAIASQIPLENTVQHYDWGGTSAPIIESVSEVWSDQFSLASKETTLDGTSTSEVTYQYGSGGAVTQKQEYDFSSGTPTTVLRTTVNKYQTFPENPLFPLTYQSMPSTLLTFPCQSIVYSGNATGTRVAETDIEYDGGTSVCGTAGTPSVTGVSGLPSGTHDETYYGPSSSTPAPRGNATSVIKQCFPSCTNPTSTYTYTYDETGQALTMTDPCGNATCGDMTVGNHKTAYAYTDSYSSCSGAAPPSGNTNAYLTEITDPLGHTQKFCYGYTDGQLRGSTDENTQTTTYGYSDPLNRLTVTKRPDTGATSYAYNDAPPAPSVTTTILAAPSPTITSVSTRDGMGHVTQTEIASAPTPIFTNTKYDGLGRVYTASNPHYSASSSTDGTTTYGVDAIGRTKTITEQDNSVKSYVYAGNITTVTDEAGNQRKTQNDGLGDLTYVWEAPNASGFDYPTNYSYDALDDLTSVLENSSHPRTFAYDSLARLTSATNPESGQVSYVYDANGNVQTRKDARSTLTTYTYDVLNRVTNKAYSDGTPTGEYFYDATSWQNINLGNTVGRLAYEGAFKGTSWLTSEGFSYDAMGRVTNNSQCLALGGCPSGPASVLYTYDLAGHTTSFSNGMGVTFSYLIDGAGRTTQIAGLNNPPQYPEVLAAVNSSTGFWPNGAVRNVLLGNGLTETSVYNDRLQPCRLNVNSSTTALVKCTDAIPSGSVQDFNYGFNYGADNGNVASWVATGQQTFNRSYLYDPLNRLSTMGDSATNQACKGLAWVYDAWGNRTQQNVTSGSCLAPQTPVNPANNQLSISGDTYDAAGNLIADGYHTYTYDAENRLATVDGGSTATYTYDANGQRVAKTSSAGYVDYLYDLAGNVEGEWQVISGDTGPKAHYAYMNGGLVAEYIAGTTYFVHKDHLGSTRLVTGATQSPVDNMDYLPFGEQTSGDSSISHKFTGKERDPETASTPGGLNGLDDFEARYMASRLGRFMSPDRYNASGFENKDDPQGWNGYSYSRNNPLLYTDPGGEVYQICTTDENGKKQCTSVSDRDFDQAQDTNGQGGNYLKNGGVYYTDEDGNQVQIGTYVQTSVDLNGFAQGVGSQLNQMPIHKFIGAFAVGSVALGATGGAVCAAACGSLGTATTLAGGAADATAALPGQLQTLIELVHSGDIAKAYAYVQALASTPEGQGLLRAMHQLVSALIAQFGQGTGTLAEFHVLLNVQEMTGKFLH